MRWLASYTVLSKIVAVVWIVLTLLYNHNAAFHHTIYSNFNHLPLLVQEITELIVIPLAIAIGHQWVRPTVP
jgi:hypothetical protein